MNLVSVISTEYAVWNIVSYLTFFLLFLVAGVFWGNWFSLSRSYHAFTAKELAQIAKVTIRNLAVPMRLLSMSLVLLLIAAMIFFPDKSALVFYCIPAALLSIATALVITVVIEVPINNQVVTWDAGNEPENWKTIRNRWQKFNNVRVIMALLAFLFFATACLFTAL